MNNLFHEIFETVNSGPPLTFNNGLIIKPTIRPRHFYSEDETTKEKVIVIILKDHEMKSFKKLDVHQYHLIHKTQELWLEVDNIYFVLQDVPHDIIAEFRYNNIILYFQKEDSTFLNAFKISFHQTKS